MANLTCRIVRPDKLLYEGPAAHLVLVSHTGEVGVWPGHGAAILALGDGVMRLAEPEERGGATRKVVISGGYAEIKDDVVIVLADHARLIDDIDPDVVRQTEDAARKLRDSLPEGDHRRAYYENKINWCELLLEQAQRREAERAS